MFRNSKLLLAVFVGSTVIPYVMSTTGTLKSLAARFSSQSSDKGDAEHPADGATEPAAIAANSAGGTASARVASGGGSIAGATAVSKPTASVRRMEDALRFDITTAWVVTNWPRVSANLAELDVQGYRVPLVTGTTPTDIAGSLTYYFNSKQRLERITFFGTTGDAGKLIALLESRFGFKKAETPEPNLYVYQVKSWSFGKVTSEMRIRPVPVIRSETPNARYEVALLIERPKSMD